ncbi:hypothetical protein V6N12_002672 [Hibiscus sabdariffa]|uniref:Uncharacterized protein n=1 Tax=Hibiscus sabdariffa TaxID=183260 RepID=A0ABR2E9P1_9ROSI
MSKLKESGTISHLEVEKEKENSNNGCGEDEVVNVIATTPSNQQTAQNVNKIAPDQSQRFKPVVAASMEREDGTSTCEQQSVQAKESSTGMVVASEKQEDVENATIPSSFSSSMFLKILRKVWFKLVRNPNSYSSLLGLSWALVSCREYNLHPDVLSTA